MSGRAVYVIDTSALIEMKVSYPPDVFRGPWEKFSKLADDGRIIAPRQVYDEIHRYAPKDYLKTWASGHKKIFRKPASELFRIAKKILSNHPKLIDPKSEFEQADPYVIALAMYNEPQEKLFQDARIVVTEEKLKDGKIPFVCASLGVQCTNTLGLFRLENWEFY